MLRLPTLTFALAAVVTCSFLPVSEALPDEDATATKPKVLLTGFGPFGNVTRNASWEAARLLHGQVIEGHEVVAVELPVEFREVWARVPRLLEEHDPKAVVHFGVYMPGPLRLERQARNSIGTIRDNAGYYPEDGRVIEDGPMIYSTQLPETELLRDMPAAGHPMVSSEDAGRYVCEFTFYTEMYFQEQQGRNDKAGFVHVAPLGRPLDAAGLSRAMTTLVEILCRSNADQAAEVSQEDSSPANDQARSGPQLPDSPWVPVTPAAKPATPEQSIPRPAESTQTPGVVGALKDE